MTDNTHPRIIQNGTDIPNSKIRQIIQFVNPLSDTPLDINVRVIYESQCDKEYHDNNMIGSYIPEMFWKMHDRVDIVDKPVVTIVVFKNTIFPTYSNFHVMRALCPQWEHSPPRILIKELKRARLQMGHSVIVYLSLDEYLVRVIAHELRHNWQAVTQYVKPITETMRKSTIQKIKLKQEKDADGYAVQQVRRWRKLHSPKDAFPYSRL